MAKNQKEILTKPKIPLIFFGAAPPQHVNSLQAELKSLQTSSRQQKSFIDKMLKLVLNLNYLHMEYILYSKYAVETKN